MAPSNLTPLGLIRHMTDVERSWFRTRAAGDLTAIALYCTDDNEDGDFDDVADADAERDYTAYVAELDLLRERLDGVTGD